VRDGDGIDSVVSVEEFNDRFEAQSISLPVEVLSLEESLDVSDGLVVDKQ
jgi:hypothetical protein